MKNILIVIALLFAKNAFSQVQFISGGRITYERKINMWASIKGEYADQFKKAVPQFKTDNFVLEFIPQKSLYSIQTATAKTMFFNLPSADNIVYTDFVKDEKVTAKNIFEKSYLITDSLRNAKWKIKDDFREIAGFNCRRATTIIMDSVFVVAFYTDEMTVPGGPESFCGLPGMIMGLVINRVHTTWYATKVELNADEKKIQPPVKGTKITMQEVQNQLEKSLKNWGAEADMLKWMISL